jgi:hypothetical protein
MYSGLMGHVSGRSGAGCLGGGGICITDKAGGKFWTGRLSLILDGKRAILKVELMAHVQIMQMWTEPFAVMKSGCSESW